MGLKIKHLEFIQGVINRMANNSFLLKGWAVTLISALFVLSAKDVNHKYILVAYIPVITFWILDGYFIFQERLFRALYNNVSKLDEGQINFSMDTSHFKKNGGGWLCTMFSPTLLWFYLPLIVMMLITMYFLN